MPPSRRSSSSHRSSSSRSHSSHSSSRSHSRSYSSHSSSSRSHSSGSFSGYSNYSRRTASPPPARPRSNQPVGYSGTVAPALFRTRTHDYYYYPRGWADESTGTYYSAGYYDETGKHYDHVAVKNGSNYETIMSCDYCGTQIKLKWTEGAIPSCPNCGALLQEVATNSVFDEKIQDQVVSSSMPSGAGSRILKGVLLALAGALLMPVILTVCVIIALAGNGTDTARTTTTASSAYVQQDEDNSIYVDVLGRYCDWDDEFECYYDEETDCYFVFEDEADPPEWHYWYEGISSDYGDYGWMAYDYDEHLWYIETSNGNWEVLPGSYDANSLWHMEEMGTGKFEGQNEFYVPALDRNCPWIPDEEAYYDEETDCYFYYNDYVEPPIWQYWYNGISSDYGDYGAMEYDTEEGCWYIETEEGWQQLPDTYDTEGLWYIE